MSTSDPKGYYAILGLAPTADAAEIKAAFRRKAMELHPDRNKSPDATEQFQLLTEANGILSEPASRAQYDTMTIKSGPRASTATHEPPEPVACSCCGKVTAQPRYAIFYQVVSVIFSTTRSAVQGIFCSVCAEKKALKASAFTWLFGWWGFPWGPIYSVQAIFNNMIGGQRPADINARLAAHQAWVFAALGKIDMARAIAMDALALAKKVKFDQGMARRKKDLGYEVRDEGAELRAEIEKLLEALGKGGNGRELKDAWALFRRPFHVQGLVTLSVIGALWYAMSNQQPYHPPRGQKPYVSAPQPVPPAKPAYVRALKAPGGELWPTSAKYLKGFPRVHANGLSTVTVDNSQNESDVLVKLVSLDGPNAYPVRVFFIPARGSFTANKVTAGSYDVRYRDLSSGGLSRSEKFTLEEIKSYDGTQFSNITMTLYKVRNGNMQTYALAESDF